MYHIIMSKSVDSIMFIYVSNCSKTHKMRDKTVEKVVKTCSWLLKNSRNMWKNC